MVRRSPARAGHQVQIFKPWSPIVYGEYLKAGKLPAVGYGHYDVSQLSH
jgi:hypothetical protein